MQGWAAFEVIVFANSRYEDPELQDLPRVASQCARLAGMFELLNRPVPDAVQVSLFHDVGQDVVAQRLNAWTEQRGENTLTLMYWAGHGPSRNSASGTDLQVLDGSVELADVLSAAGARRNRVGDIDSGSIVVVVDVCDGQEALTDAARQAFNEKFPDGVALFSAGRGTTYAGIFQADSLAKFWSRPKNEQLSAGELFGDPVLASCNPQIPNPFNWPEARERASLAMGLADFGQTPPS